MYRRTWWALIGGPFSFSLGFPLGWSLGNRIPLGNNEGICEMWERSRYLKGWRKLCIGNVFVSWKIFYSSYKMQAVLPQRELAESPSWKES